MRTKELTEKEKQLFLERLAVVKHNGNATLRIVYQDGHVVNLEIILQEPRERLHGISREA